MKFATCCINTMSMSLRACRTEHDVVRSELDLNDLTRRITRNTMQFALLIANIAKTGYGTTSVVCRGGSRYVEG